MCRGEGEITHKQLGKEFCFKCWEKYCDKLAKKDYEQAKIEQGKGLYRWLR